MPRIGIALFLTRAKTICTVHAGPAVGCENNMSFMSLPSARGVVETARDPRWHALSLVQSARSELSLRDRDITVLRGLLSLITTEAWSSGGRIIVYASNRTLSERCDGIEERTLRRRLLRLSEAGLIRRELSPNRKRYSLRDTKGEIVIAYGFDLAPLRTALPHLTQLAKDAAANSQRLRLLRAVLRDRLWQARQQEFSTDPALPRLLRNKVTAEELQSAIDSLPAPEANEDVEIETVKMSDSDSEIVRDIQSSYKDNIDKEEKVLALSAVLDQAPTAIEYAPEPIRDWHALAGFIQIMSTAIAIEPALMRKAVQALGRDGASLAVLGLLEAGQKIHHPAKYLNRLIQQANAGTLNIKRMFAYLTQKTDRFRQETLYLA